MNFLDLFCGAGGLSCGLEMAGLNCLLGIDHVETAIETFRKNHEHSEAIVGDIRQIRTEQVKEIICNKKVDLICGGPPCQGFSTVGTNNSKDSRNSLFLEFVRMVRDFEPEYIIMENVTGLLSRRNQDTLVSIIKCFNELGYAIDVRVLSAHNYGVPEKRRRTIFLGNKHGIENIYPCPVFDETGDCQPRTVGWAFENLIYTSEGNCFNHEIATAQIPNETEKARISHIPEGGGVRYQKDEVAYLPERLWLGVDWDTISENRLRETTLQRLDRNKPSPTINTSRTVYYHPTEDRYLTAREAAAIQSFPLDFQFCGSLTQQWRQIGNAVPPLLGRAIGQAVLELDETKENRRKVSGEIDISKIRKHAFNYNKDISKMAETGTLFDLIPAG